MKHKETLFGLALVVLLLHACKGENSRHEIRIDYPLMESLTYADQMADSVVFSTFDSYEVSTINSPWIELLPTTDPVKATLPNLFYTWYRVRIDVKMTPNTSKDCRMGYIKVKSYGEDWNETVSTAFYQTTWHNITIPAPEYTYDSNRTITNAKFTAQDSANQVVQDLAFQTYDKWELIIPEGSFVKAPADAILMGGEGVHKLTLEVEKNTSATERSTELKLITDNGVTTPIVVKQEGTKLK